MKRKLNFSHLPLDSSFIEEVWWEAGEKEQLFTLLSRYGLKKFHEIANAIPTKSPIQVKRYLDLLQKASEDESITSATISCRKKRRQGNPAARISSSSRILREEHHSNMLAFHLDTEFIRYSRPISMVDSFSTHYTSKLSVTPEELFDLGFLTIISQLFYSGNSETSLPPPTIRELFFALCDYISKILHVCIAKGNLTICRYLRCDVKFLKQADVLQFLPDFCFQAGLKGRKPMLSHLIENNLNINTIGRDWKLEVGFPRYYYPIVGNHGNIALEAAFRDDEAKYFMHLQRAQLLLYDRRGDANYQEMFELELEKLEKEEAGYYAEEEEESISELSDTEEEFTEDDSELTEKYNDTLELISKDDGQTTTEESDDEEQCEGIEDMAVISRNENESDIYISSEEMTTDESDIGSLKDFVVEE